MYRLSWWFGYYAAGIGTHFSRTIPFGCPNAFADDIVRRISNAPLGALILGAYTDRHVRRAVSFLRCGMSPSNSLDCLHAGYAPNRSAGSVASV